MVNYRLKGLLKWPLLVYSHWLLTSTTSSFTTELRQPDNYQYFTILMTRNKQQIQKQIYLFLCITLSSSTKSRFCRNTFSFLLISSRDLYSLLYSKHQSLKDGEEEACRKLQRKRIQAFIIKMVAKNSNPHKWFLFINSKQIPHGV